MRSCDIQRATWSGLTRPPSNSTTTPFDSLPLVSQSLTGRLHRLEILPLSQGEIAGSRENLVEALLDDPDATLSPDPSATTRDEFVELVARGGFPLALARTGAARARWFDDYLALCLERDLLEEGRVRQPAALASLLARLASQTAQVLNMSSAGRAVGLAASTASDYVRLFEAAFLLRLLPCLGQDPALGDRVASQAPHGGL